MRKGICCAGNVSVDLTYYVNIFPQEGELVHIESSSARSLGGLAANCIIDLAKMDPELPLVLAGNAGNDELGTYTRSVFSEYANIDASGLKSLGDTAYTLAISNLVTKSRTFFTYPGGNNVFCEEDIDWDNLDVDLLHVGYIFLMPALDLPDSTYGTKMAKLLHTAKEHGLKTSIDIVSQSGADFAHMVPPALKYTDYLIINELEAQQTTGITLRDADGLHRENMKAALQTLKDFGVSTWTVIHCPEFGCGLDENGDFFTVNSLNLPDDYIKGTTGAGDAFCAGVLYAAEKVMGMEKALLIGNCSAAASLSEPCGTEGLRSLEEVLKLKDIYGLRPD
ncbi:MAG: carbohydrate kinase family protein [Eubacteriales bacterium]|nr:carbohydrate kinase family protein [Eubacteriales bacterium]